MAKKNEEEARPGVVFTLSGDAMQPRELPWGAGLRFPLPVKVEAGKHVRVNYLVASSLPVLLVPMRRLAEYGLELIGGVRVVPAGTNIEVEIASLNKGGEVFLESGEMLVAVHPLRWDHGFGIG